MKKEEITLKNTKVEILDALNAALEREKNVNKTKSNPEKEEQDRVVKKAVENSKSNVEKKIFSDELINKFNDLEIAIKAEEEKLRNLYGVEGELCNITLVINAGKDLLSEMEGKKKEATENYNESLKALELEYKKKTEVLVEEYEAKAKSLKVEREREIEEYNYKTKRDREISNNKWEDEKTKRENDLAIKEGEIAKLLSEAKLNESKTKELEIKVGEIPALLEKEYDRGRKEIMKELEKEHNYTVELLKRDYQNTIDRQEDRIGALKEEIEKTNSLNKQLQDRLDKAYIQIKELATKTVESTGGVKIIANNQGDK